MLEMSASTEWPELVGAMGPVAREVLGEPTEESKARRELRFRTRGSLCISLDTGTWFDHELGEGGGVLAFVQDQLGVDKAGAIAWLRDRGHISKAPAPKANIKREVAAYNYLSAEGELLFQVVRYEPKDFRQRRPNGNGSWIWKMDGVRKVVYRLPEVIAAVAAGRIIFVVEGEKAVHALESIGLVGTCSPGGAGKWQRQYGEFLAGADVVVLPDNDPQATMPDGTPRWHPDGRPILPGQDHAADVAKQLRDVVGQMRVLMLPDLPPKGDVADWIAAGGTVADIGRLLAEIPEPAGTVCEQPAMSEDLQPPPEIDDPAYFEAIAAAIAPDPIAALITEFNDRYMVVNEAGKAIVYEPAHDDMLNRRYCGRITFDDFKRLYLNRRIRIPQGGEGNTALKPVSEVWLNHPERRQFIGGVVFDPSGLHVRQDSLNLWQGMAIQPRPGSWARLQDHMLQIICAGNQGHFDWLLGWMGRLVQRPAEQGEVAVVMRGVEGSGKGTLAKVLLHIFGQHGLAISNAKHLTGNFNGHLRDTVLLFADEAFFAGDRAHVGVLKALITEPFLTIEAKYQNAIQMPNFVHLMMASNEEWVVPAGLEARRFFVLEVAPDRANDHAYFAALWSEMASGGYEAMLHDLLAYDLASFNHRAAPNTAGLQTQKKLSLPTAEHWWSEVLYRGYVFKSRHGLEDYFSRWHEQMTTEVLFDAYELHAKAQGERHPLSREAFGRFMARMGGKAIKPRNVVTGERIADIENIQGGTNRRAELVRTTRSHGYGLGSLEIARLAFERVTELRIDWPKDDAPEE